MMFAGLIIGYLCYQILAMEAIIPSPRWLRRGGLYEPRFSSSITGETCNEYEKLMQILKQDFSSRVRTEICKIPLPVDIDLGKALIPHQHSLFGEIRQLALKDMNNHETAKNAIEIVEAKIFYGDGLFNLALPGLYCSSDYVDPSLNMLLPYYDFLSLVIDIQKPCCLYDLLDRTEFISKLFDLLISPDRRERTMVVSLILNLMDTHSHHREFILNRTAELMKVISSAGLDHVPTRMAIPLIDIYDRRITNMLVENFPSKPIFSAFEDGFLQLFHTPYLREFIEAWDRAFTKSLRMLKTRIWNYLLVNTYNNLETSYLMEEGQTVFWTSKIVSPSVEVEHLENIVTRIFLLVKNNPRDTIWGVFSNGLSELIPIFSESAFVTRFTTADQYYDFVGLILHEIYLWLLETYHHKMAQHAKKLKLIFEKADRLHQDYLDHFKSNDDREVRISSIIELHTEILTFNFAPLLARAPSRERYHAVMEAANRRLAAEKSTDSCPRNTVEAENTEDGVEERS